MRPFQQLLLVLLGTAVWTSPKAQLLTGTWRGTLLVPSNSTLRVQTTAALRVSGETLTGTINVQANGTTDTYTLQGKASGGQAAGTATYLTDGTVFQFEAVLQNDQLLFGIGQNGAVLMRGTLSRAITATETTTAATKANRPAAGGKPDGLYRDPALIGIWQTTSQYGGGITDGGFYGSTSSRLILNTDGTIADGGSSGYASGAGVSVQSSGGSNEQGTVARLNELGARWFTKGNLVYVRVRVNGQLQDIAASKYFVEGNRMLITDLKTGKKTLYKRP